VEYGPIDAQGDAGGAEPREVGALVVLLHVVADDPEGDAAPVGVEDGAGDPVVGDGEDADVDGPAGRARSAMIWRAQSSPGLKNASDAGTAGRRRSGAGGP
jgi:hypothetical protein